MATWAGEDDARRHRRRLAARVALVATGVLVLGAGAWLTAPSWGVRLADRATLSITGDAATTTVAQFGARGAHLVEYVDGAEVRLRVALHNDGRLPARVEAVRLGAGPFPLLEVTGVGAVPVTIGPGEHIDVHLTARLANCAYYHEREVSVYPGVTVAYRTLGRRSEQFVPFDHDLVVHAPMIVDCPAGKLDRSQVNRYPADSRQ